MGAMGKISISSDLPRTILDTQSAVVWEITEEEYQSICAARTEDVERAVLSAISASSERYGEGQWNVVSIQVHPEYGVVIVKKYGAR